MATSLSELAAFDTSAPNPQRAQWRVVLLIGFLTLVGVNLGVFTGQKITFLYKEELHLSVSEVGTLAIFIAIPAYFQFFIGAWTELYPLFGLHRRSYYLLASLIEVAGYLCLAYLRHYHYFTVLGLLLVIGAGGVMLGVIFNAVMVEVGNLTGRFGQFLSLQRFIPLVLVVLYAGRLSGYVLQHWSYHACFLMAALLCLIRMPAALLIDEKRIARSQPVQLTYEELQARQEARKAEHARTRAALQRAVATPGLWVMVVFVFYLILTPGIFTAELYYMTDVLHLSKQFIGNLNIWRSVGTLAGILLFAFGYRRLPVWSLVWGAWLMDCLSYPALLLLHDATSAIYVSILSTLIGVVYGLCLSTLAARACPPGIEGTVYGLVMAAIALGGTLSEKLGGVLYDYFGPLNKAHHYTITHGWVWALWYGFGFTVLAAVFIPFLPAWTRSREPLHGSAEAVVTTQEDLEPVPVEG